MTDSLLPPKTGKRRLFALGFASPGPYRKWRNGLKIIPWLIGTILMDFSQRFDSHVQRVDAWLDRLLREAALSDQTDQGARAVVPADISPSTPENNRLVTAMHYAATNGGKRLRPVLVIETAALFGVPPDACLNAAAAIECVHCYSLVHDDLPCMDNDSLRRGQPTVWKAYDEWTAILAGDALLTLAFELLSRPDTHGDGDVRLALIATLAKASGASGMAQGQAMDLAASALSEHVQLDLRHVKLLQALKTGALIEAACLFGALLGQGDANAKASLQRFGQALGLAFQISDDLLDQEGNAQVVGKATGKDTAAGKATFVSLLGLEGARRELRAALEDANAALSEFGARADPLRDIATFIAQRQH